MSEDSPEYSALEEAQKTLERAFRVRFERTEVSEKAASQIEKAKERVSQGHTFQWTGTQDYPDLLVFPPQEHDEETRWIFAKEAVCKLGFTQRDAAEKYGLSYDYLRKKAQREEWPIPARVSEAVQQLSQKVAHNRAITRLEAETWLERAEKSRQMGWALTERPLQSILNDPEKAPKVASWQDVATIVKLNRQAAGLDDGESKGGNNLTLNLIQQRLEVPAIEGEYVVGDLPE